MRFALLPLALCLLSCGPSRTGFDVNAARIVRSGDSFDPLHNACSVTRREVGGESAYVLAFTDVHYPDPQMVFAPRYSTTTGQMIDWDLALDGVGGLGTSCPSATITTTGDPRTDEYLDVRATFPATGCGDPGTSTVVGHIYVYGCPVTR